MKSIRVSHTWKVTHKPSHSNSDAHIQIHHRTIIKISHLLKYMREFQNSSIDNLNTMILGINAN